MSNPERNESDLPNSVSNINTQAYLSTAAARRCLMFTELSAAAILIWDVITMVPELASGGIPPDGRINLAIGAAGLTTVSHVGRRL